MFMAQAFLIRCSKHTKYIAQHTSLLVHYCFTKNLECYTHFIFYSEYIKLKWIEHLLLSSISARTIPTMVESCYKIIRPNFIFKDEFMHAESNLSTNSD